MTRKRKPKVFLETSGVIYAFHGERRMKAEVESAVRDSQVFVSSFIRMEYLRGVVCNLIDLYFVIKDEDSVQDALVRWTQTKFNQPRKFIIVMNTISPWITTQEDSQSKEKSLRRLGDMIVNLVRRFDDLYKQRIQDDVKCELGRVGFQKDAFDENLLLDFYERFQAIRKRVATCGLCRFKEKQVGRMTRGRIDLISVSQRANFKKNDGYIKQAENVEKVVEKESPKCSICDKVGDTIIATHFRADTFTLVTADRSFDAFAQILEFKVHRLQSLSKLLKSGGATTAPSPSASSD